MGNVKMFQNKIDKLADLMKTQRMYWEYSLVFLMETWLTCSIPDANAEPCEFISLRADRDTKAMAMVRAMEGDSDCL